MAEREREFRPLRRNKRIVGIFGWPFPILNSILTFFDRLRERRLARFSTPSTQKVGGGTPILRNVERVKVIRDSEGGLKELEIHREVHR